MLPWRAGALYNAGVSGGTHCGQRQGGERCQGFGCGCGAWMHATAAAKFGAPLPARVADGRLARPIREIPHECPDRVKAFRNGEGYASRSRRGAAALRKRKAGAMLSRGWRAVGACAASAWHGRDPAECIPPIPCIGRRGVGAGNRSKGSKARAVWRPARHACCGWHSLNEPS
jgi:hypothetical protein